MVIKQPGSRNESLERKLIKIEDVDKFTDRSAEFTVGKTPISSNISKHIVNIPIDIYSNSNLKVDSTLQPSMASI